MRACCWERGGGSNSAELLWKKSKQAKRNKNMAQPRSIHNMLFM